MTGVNDNLLKPNLSLLSSKQQLAFALILCERLMPFFSWFASQTTFGSTRIYRHFLDDAWRHLVEENGAIDWTKAAGACHSAAPHMDDYDHPLKSEALRAALAVEATMEFLADGQMAHILQAAEFTNDVACFYANRRSARPPRSLPLKELLEHPYLRKELDRQLADLHFVELLPANFTDESVSSLKERIWSGPGR